MRKFLLFILLPLIALSVSLAAVTMATADTDPGIAALQAKLGFTVVKAFETPAPGVTGYVVKAADGKNGIVHGVGEFVMGGALIDAQGNDLTRQYAAIELPKKDFEAVAAALSQDPHLVSEGAEDAPEIYVFADPNCGFCHKFWEQTRDWVADGKLRLHWVMVGFLAPSSAGYSAAIIHAEDRVAALHAFKQSFGRTGKGGIDELDPVPAELKAVLQQHGQWMAELGFSGTPGLLYKDTHGQWKGQTGVPRPEALAEELGITR